MRRRPAVAQEALGPAGGRLGRPLNKHDTEILCTFSAPKRGKGDQGCLNPCQGGLMGDFLRSRACSMRPLRCGAPCGHPRLHGYEA
jgi:hypothetical protein